MKFIFLSDSHIKGINPSSRKGDYYKDVMLKIDEVISLSKELGVDCVIHGGDLFDSSKVSNLIVDDFVDKVEQAGIQWWIVPGNHDEEGHSWENSKGTSLAHIFRRSKYISQLVFYSEGSVQDGVQWYIQPFKYHHNIEKDIIEKGLFCNSKFSKLKIAITHALITLKPFHPDVLHVVAKDIKTDFDIILCAHYHKVWGIKEINGTKFVNIGCLGRTSINEADIKPSVLLVETDPKLSMKIIGLKSAKSKEKVFDLDRIEKAKEFNADIENFINSLKDTKISGLDLRGIIENIAKEKKAECYIVDEVIERIGKYE